VCKSLQAARVECPSRPSELASDASTAAATARSVYSSQPAALAACSLQQLSAGGDCELSSPSPAPLPAVAAPAPVTALPRHQRTPCRCQFAHAPPQAIRCQPSTAVHGPAEVSESPAAKDAAPAELPGSALRCAGPFRTQLGNLRAQRQQPASQRKRARQQPARQRQCPCPVHGLCWGFTDEN
jgi:hypothetical protein